MLAIPAKGDKQINKEVQLDETGETICGWLSFTAPGPKAKNHRAIFEMCRKYNCRSIARFVFSRWHRREPAVSIRAVFAMAYEYQDLTLAHMVLARSIKIQGQWWSCLSPAEIEEEYLDRLRGATIGKLCSYLREHKVCDREQSHYIKDMKRGWEKDFHF